MEGLVITDHLGGVHVEGLQDQHITRTDFNNRIVDDQARLSGQYSVADIRFTTADAGNDGPGEMFVRRAARPESVGDPIERRGAISSARENVQPFFAVAAMPGVATW
jgi:hypothetical protein